MPKLPSGKEAGMSFESLLDKAEEATFDFWFTFKTNIQSGSDLPKLIEVLYFRESDQGSGRTDNFPGTPFPSGLTVADIQYGNCDWSLEDREYFLSWFSSIFPSEKLDQLYIELSDMLKTFKGPLPDGWKGLFD